MPFRRCVIVILWLAIGIPAPAIELASQALSQPASSPVAFPPGVSLPPGLFVIPASQPQTIITAESLRLASGVATLEGRVKAIREGDLLTAGRALLGQNPTWVLATLTPRLYRKETISEKQLTRETTLDASNIWWNSTSGELDASDSVVLKVEERTWDLGTYTWFIISADHMIGHRDRKVMTFHGNVRMKDKTRFGMGEHLDYFRASSTAILTGNAHLEGEEWSEKNKRMEKRTIDGQRIEYRLDTKAMKSE